MQNTAASFATNILWAATGRQFGTCPITVRPCLQNGEWGLWYNNGNEWGWSPYIWNGQWFNGGSCGCSGQPCSLHPFTQIRLLGPVAGVSEVSIGGIVLDSSTYRVDDAQWLVRQDGNTWPLLQDLNLAAGLTNTWTVTYFRGTPVPDPLIAAAGTLACEYLKSCTGDAACRLSSRVTSIIRAGVEMTMTSIDDLIKLGMTGLPEVDMLIHFYNPSMLTHRLRVYTPDVNRNRITTSS